MTNNPIQSIKRGRNAGFTLIELMVAMAVFLVIGGAAVTLVSTHAKLSNQTQSQVSLTMGLRNAVATMEVDASNAGAGFFSTGSNPADWPIGITVKNRPQPCNPGTPASTTYGLNCFDTLNIITTDSNVGAVHPTTIIDTNTTTTVIVTPPGVPSAANAAAFALLFKSGDELLWLKPGNPKSSLTTTTLTANGAASGNNVQLTFASTTGTGINSTEKYLITQGLGTDPGDTTPALTHSFSPVTDWVLRLNAIQYSVDSTTDPANPKLMRIQGTQALAAGGGDVVAEQIIGFRVGVSIRRANVDQPYTFNMADYNSDWTEIRSVRISLIGRTPPNQDGSDQFRNAFDNGPYRIQGISVTINPRNLSMND